ncbi:MAG: diguanylate cyclase [Candidatus Omnitrophota bacterium]|nr:diguanylate cyclase [Candidatus Omnitrophota bacterium]
MAELTRTNAELAYIDDLTGLYNRRYLKFILPQELTKAKDQKASLSLFMIDFDNFKGINDTYGHLNGDKVLIDISNILKSEIGQDGIFIRYAGDEFTVLLAGKRLKEATLIGYKLLEVISRHKLELKSGKNIPAFSFSVGVAVYPDDAGTVESLLDKADQALYSAKRMGKNRLATSGDIIQEAHDREMVLSALPCKNFISREKELEHLKKSYEAMQEGARKYLLIRGAGGVGKTRLMMEAFNPDETDPKPLLLKCRKEDMYQPYGAISRALRDYHGLKEALSDKDTFDTIIGLIHNLGLKKILVLIDDILWIDSESLKVVQWILESKEFSGSLLVATVSKDPFNADKMPQPDILDLAPLPETSVSELLSSVFPGLAIPSGLQKKIFQASGGYPALAEEMLKYILKKKIIYVRDGRWMLDEKNIGSVPSSITDLVDKFISELDNETREVLSKAAVLGNDFNVNILKGLYGKNEGQLVDTLDKLREEGILGKDILADSNILSFVNSIIKESIYNNIRKAELQQMHKRVADLIKDYYKSETGAYSQLRYHLEEAGEAEGMPERALPSAEEIAEKPLSESSAKIAPNVVMLLRAAWLNSHLYPLDNKTCVDSIESLYGDIKSILGNDPTLTIMISGEDAIINGEPVSKKKLSAVLSRALASLFSEYGISSITFKKGMDKRDLISLFSIVIKEEDAEKTGTFAKMLKEKGVASIKIDEVKYRKASEIKAGGQGIGDKSKIARILEDLGKMADRKQMTDAFLSMDPSLRTQMIAENSSLINGILSGLTDDQMANILKDGVDIEAAKKAMAEAQPEPFFDEMAKKFIGVGKADVLENKVITNLRPLTEALIIKGDRQTIEDLAKSLFAKLASESPSVRLSAAEGLGKMLNVLLEKEIFDISAGVITGTARCLKAEENIKVYAEILKDMEDAVSTLIQKQRPSLLISPLLAMADEVIPDSKRSGEFKRHAKASITRAITPENMNILLLSLKSKTEKDYTVIIGILSQLEEEVITSLIDAMCRKGDMKLDPFDTYIKKHNVAAIIKKMGEGAIAKVKELLSDKRPHVAVCAVEVFGHINEVKYLPYLETGMLNPDKEVRKAALEAIKKMPAGDDTVKLLVRILPGEKEPSVSSKIMDLICELASKQFAPYVKNELKGRIRLDDYDKLVAKLAAKK